ncbi:MAG: hypothetical protein PSX37_04520 [bacterium]|nr:hypothetical protein [bacterium]
MSKDAFFVGYLATPPALRSSNRLIACLLFTWLALAGLTFAAFQFDSGPSTWNAEIVETRGTFRCIEGVPFLEVARSGTIDGVLLVRPGKFALPEAYCGPPVAQTTNPGGLDLPVSGFEDQAVVVRGTVLSRNSHQMIEVIAIDPVADPSAPEPQPAYPRSPIRVRGEVVDSKCYLGAMKPGTGPVHRSCAALCLAGGIPAGLVTAGTPDEFRVLAKAPFNGARWVGDSVEVNGELVRIGSLGIIILPSEQLSQVLPGYREAR